MSLLIITTFENPPRPQLYLLTILLRYSLTFFAPDDKSIPRRDEDRRSPRSLHEIAPHHHDALFQLFLHVEALDEDQHKGNDKERDIIKEIVRQVMRYHILMDELKFHNLGFNSSGTLNQYQD